jgi:hypothetical protein
VARGPHVAAEVRFADRDTFGTYLTYAPKSEQRTQDPLELLNTGENNALRSFGRCLGGVLEAVSAMV